MNKHFKLIYILRLKGKTIREIKKILLDKYNIIIIEKEVNRIVKLINYQKSKFNEVDKKKILYMYENCVNTEKLIEYLNNKYYYGLTIQTLRWLTSQNGIKKKTQNMYKQSFVTRNDEYNIKKLYESGMTAKEIANLYGYKTKEAIYNKLDKLSVKRRCWNEEQSKKKSYKNFSINKIDNKIKAYFLGLMLTDGYVNSDRGYIGIDLVDLDCITFLANYINTSYKTIDKKKENLQLRYRLILYGRNYIEDGKRLALIDKKTFSDRAPILDKEEEEYLPFIIRGAIDGDGWIRKDGEEFFICSASRVMINWYKEIMEKIGFVDLKISFIKNQWNGIYQIRSGVKYNIFILKNKVYKEPMGMGRKYNLLL